jgi:hypothetical protein
MVGQEVRNILMGRSLDESSNRPTGQSDFPVLSPK